MLPIINNDKGAKWVTFGDGRYGSDARYFQEQGVDVMATDLNTEILERAKNDGYINKFEKVNAEKMPFADNSFDYAFCKGSYHHFPRPMVALAEMLRVSKNAVCLIEPQDQHIFTRDRIKKFPAKDLLYRAFVNYVRVTFFKKPSISVIGEIGMPDLEPAYEPVGNYVYEISRPELKKVCYGQNFDAIAFMDVNEHYIFGGESEVANDNSEIFKTLKGELKTMDERCEKGVQNYNYLIAVLFKKMPSDKMISDMERIGFDVEKLTKNPHWV
jgi:SAM-dependent methyltransferase